MLSPSFFLRFGFNTPDSFCQLFVSTVVIIKVQMLSHPMIIRNSDEITFVLSQLTFYMILVLLLSNYYFHTKPAPFVSAFQLLFCVVVPRWSGKVKTCLTWCVARLVWGRPGSLDSGTQWKTPTPGWNQRNGWVEEQIARAQTDLWDSNTSVRGYSCTIRWNHLHIAYLPRTLLKMP